MPLTSRGRKIKRSMYRTYRSEQKAEQVFHASRRAGTIKGVERSMRGYAAKRHVGGY